MDDDDKRVAAAFLQQAINNKVEHNGAIVTIDEMIREVFGEDASPEQREAAHRVTVDLRDSGLIHFQHERFIDPTRAAIRYAELQRA